MRNRLIQTLRCLAVGIIVALASGCGARTVVDEAGWPMAGVHVVAVYWVDGPGFYGSPGHCVRTEALITAADGKFEFPFFSGDYSLTLPKRKTYIRVFKAGYERVPEQPEGGDFIKMRPFSGDATQRFEGDYYIYDNGCPDKERKLYPLIVAIHAEAKTLAKTYKERSTVLAYETIIDAPRIGLEVARERGIAKTNALRKEMGVTTWP